jgi:hypothetical protein
MQGFGAIDVTLRPCTDPKRKEEQNQHTGGVRLVPGSARQLLISAPVDVCISGAVRLQEGQLCAVQSKYYTRVSGTCLRCGVHACDLLPSKNHDAAKPAYMLVRYGSMTKLSPITHPPTSHIRPYHTSHSLPHHVIYGAMEDK